MEESVNERGDRVISWLLAAGQSLDLDVRTEFPVVGGRIDVVWLWNGPSRFPVELPLVGFEVESSWRTRKHLKGDYLNLIDLNASLGVIVLLGDDSKVASTREFTRIMLDRHPGRIELWSEEDVFRLGDPEKSGSLLAASEIGSEKTSKLADSRHTGKYRALTQWLSVVTSGTRKMTFSEVEEIIGFPLPPSCRKHPAHWSGYEGSAVARAIHDAGWRATQLDLQGETVAFEKVQK